MRYLKTEKQQIIINKANNKQNFTYYLKNNQNRYIVGAKNIFKGANPSLKCNLLKDVANILKNYNFDSIGGWLDKKSNIYYIDANFHYNNKIEALKVAKILKEIAIFDNLENKVINL